MQMTGKGSKPRPLSVKQNEFDTQWDLIFGGKGMKHQHSRGLITEEIDRYISVNAKREAVIVKTEKGLMVELYEKSRYIRAVDCTAHSIQYARDTAENYASGVLK